MLISVSKLLSDLDISEKLICQHLKDFLSWHLILDQVKLCWKKWYLITRIRYHIITHPITFHNIKHIITDGWLKLIIVNWCVCIVCNARYIKLKLTYETVDHDGKMLQLQLLVLILSLSWILQSCSSPQDDLQVSESLQYLYFQSVPLMGVYCIFCQEILIMPRSLGGESLFCLGPWPKRPPQKEKLSPKTP